ncbi:MAG: bifunctional riboflavin kinase/FAD synthetase [Actinobacteria bacterium]|jgi:riboflavin kinase/FMN adenylyltransferase|nr:bifunctional riboflavin kinase/FAD synthetase [Actinomycetota bacterium]
MNNSVLIGIFDGVHQGHQELIRTAKHHGKVIALTFYPHPTSIVAPERTPMQLLPLADRVSLLKSNGADDVVVLEFTPEFAALSPDEFIENILIKQLKADHVIVGENFTFGHKASGTARYLQESSHGFKTTILKLEENRGTPVSSTRIRNLIIDGDIERANEMLTRPHYLVGPVVHGEKRGREIGYPTANLGLDSLACIPADGVYAGWLSVGDQRWQAAISIGTNPTFPGVRGRQVEAYAIGESGLELYDQMAKIEFGFRLRDTLKFDSLEALLVQMKSDCIQATELTNI